MNFDLKFNMTRAFHWLIQYGSVTFDGCGPCTSYTARIYVISKGVGIDILHGDKVTATSIPALNVYEWNNDNIKYLHDWINKILEDDIILNANTIQITASGDWRLKFKDSL